MAEDDDKKMLEAKRRIREEELRAGVRRRPILASVIAIIIAIVGFLTLVGGALIILVAVGLGIAGGSVLGYDVAAFGALLGGIVFLAGLIILLVGIGLWKLRKWALYLVALPIVLYLAILAIGGAAIGPALCFSPVFIIAVLLLIYFIMIRKHFV